MLVEIEAKHSRTHEQLMKAKGGNDGIEGLKWNP